MPTPSVALRKSMLTAACTVLLLTACPDDRKSDEIRAASLDAAAAGTSDEEEQDRRIFISVDDTRSRADVPTPLAVGAPPSAASVVPAPGTVMHTGGPLPALQVPDPPFLSEAIATFNEPWAMTFLPDGRLLVTEKPGRLKLLNTGSRQVGEIAGVPAVAYGGQGGLGDVVLHPEFASNRLVYLSFAESGANNTRGAAVVRGELTLDANGGGNLSNLQLIWRQVPKTAGFGHYSHRLAFDGGGKLWISSGDRQLDSQGRYRNGKRGMRR